MTGNIYFLTDGELIKVGFANHVDERIAALQCGNGRKIECLCSAPGTVKLERALHKEIPGRVVGEWFKPSRKIFRLINAIVGSPVSERGNCIAHFIAAEEDKRRRRLAVHGKRGDRIAARLRFEMRSFLSELCDQYGADQIAKALEVSPSAVRFWVSGKAMPNALSVVRLGAYFPEMVVDLHRPLGTARAERMGIAA